MVRMVAIAALGLCACWVVGDEGPQPFRGWSHVRQDDCDGDDVAASAGDYVPLAQFCSSRSDANRIAVCWDQADFANPAMAQPWCTYKGSTQAQQCTGGAHPGYLFVCNQPP